MPDVSHEFITNHFVYPLWQEKSLEVIDQFLSVDADVRTSFLSGNGPEILKFSAKNTFNAFPNMNIFIDEVIQHESLLIYKWQANAKHEGEILGIQATGLPINFSGVVYGKLDDRQITQYHSFSNLYTVLQNLSQLLPMASNEALFYYALQGITEPSLSKREVEVLSFWLKGYAIKETARELGGLSERTVQTHREKIKQKFRAENFQQIFSKVQLSGLLPLYFGVIPQNPPSKNLQLNVQSAIVS